MINLDFSLFAYIREGVSGGFPNSCFVTRVRKFARKGLWGPPRVGATLLKSWCKRLRHMFFQPVIAKGTTEVCQKAIGAL